MNKNYKDGNSETLANGAADMLVINRGYNHNDPLVNVKGLAAYLNVPKSWVYERTRDKSEGSIPRVNVGKYVRFHVPDVLKWLKEQ
jgi:excisionase family DNA binding protein